MTTSPSIRLIGVPTDIGASVRGASMGPEALRVAGLQQALERRGLTVVDSGNLSGPPNPCLPPVDGYRHRDQVHAWNRALRGEVAATLAAGQFPLVLGGDHCLAIGSIAAIGNFCQQQRKKLRVLWLDAHSDFNTAAITPSGNIHGMPVATLFGHGAAELVALAEPSPALAAGGIVQIGIRSVDDAEKRFLHQNRVDVFDMRSVDELGMREVMSRALAGLDAGTHLHVSFDVDFLDPEIAPGVGTTVRGGPTYREAQLCMEMIADTGLLASLDVVELNPALDLQNRTAELAVDLIESLFGKSTLVRA